MKRIETTKEVEEMIRRAFEVDRILPPVVKRSGGILLGSMVVIPDCAALRIWLKMLRETGGIYPMKTCASGGWCALTGCRSSKVRLERL